MKEVYRSKGEEGKLKIVQLVTNLNEGDAIGNDILAIHHALQRKGYTSILMAQTIHPHFIRIAQNVDFSLIAPDDLLLFHKATGDQFTRALEQLKCKKVLIYHNITPGRYFLPYDAVMAWNLNRGRRQLRRLARCMDSGWGDSSYNCQEMVRSGFAERNVSVLPILTEGEKMHSAPDPILMRKLASDSRTKMLFIGRIAPNKKQEDIIKIFYHYLRNEELNTVLYLVGSWKGMEKYYAKLKGFAADLGLTEEQVIFTGHVSETEKNAYLQSADVFVCMSEHEGFCVPLLEAMHNRIPIAAYASSAVPETLGNNGLLFDRKNYEEIAHQIGRLRQDAAFREEVINWQQENLLRFQANSTEKKLLDMIDCVLGNERKSIA